ncbi:hypothetical protein B0H13DRAFT_2464835 [Mycena leptocephala]|nr:hypothetical protein B0H13DRAFT_2464835 [Mycena leptocephala]
MHERRGIDCARTTHPLLFNSRNCGLLIPPQSYPTFLPISVQIHALRVLALQAGYTEVKCDGRDLGRGVQRCTAGAGARWSARNDGSVQGTRRPEAGAGAGTQITIACALCGQARVPLEMKQTWASFFEAASGLNLGNEYVERVVVVAFTGDIDDLPNVLRSCKHPAFLNGVRSDAKMHLLVSTDHLPSAEFAKVHIRFTSFSVVLRPEFTGEGGDDGGLAGALIMDGDMIQARFLVDGSGWPIVAEYWHANILAAFRLYSTETSYIRAILVGEYLRQTPTSLSSCNKRVTWNDTCLFHPALANRDIRLRLIQRVKEELNGPEHTGDVRTQVAVYLAQQRALPPAERYLQSSIIRDGCTVILGIYPELIKNIHRVRTLDCDTTFKPVAGSMQIFELNELPNSPMIPSSRQLCIEGTTCAPRIIPQSQRESRGNLIFFRRPSSPLGLSHGGSFMILAPACPRLPP